MVDFGEGTTSRLSTGKNATPQSPHQRSSLIRTRELFFFFSSQKTTLYLPFVLCRVTQSVFFVRIFLFCFVLFCVCVSLVLCFCTTQRKTFCLLPKKKESKKKKRGVCVVLAIILSVFVVGLFFFFFFFCWCCGIGRERERERSRYFCVQNVCRVLNTTH